MVIQTDAWLAKCYALHRFYASQDAWLPTRPVQMTLEEELFPEWTRIQRVDSQEIFSSREFDHVTVRISGYKLMTADIEEMSDWMRQLARESVYREQVASHWFVAQ